MAIVSFAHGFVFVKTHKTAGTSLEVHLAAQCGPDDVVTPINPPSSSHEPRNYRRADGTSFANHMSAARLRACLPEFYDSAYTFCFERHPVDKCLSHFAMLLNSPAHDKADKPTCWDEYLEQGRFPLDDQQYLDDSGFLLVDRVYHYERLDEALDDLQTRVGVGRGPLGVREKGGFRVGGVPTYDEVMARPAQKRVIFDAFARSLTVTGYS